MTTSKMRKIFRRLLRITDIVIFALSHFRPVLALILRTCTVLYKTKSLDGTKPNTNPNTNPHPNTKPIQLFYVFFEHRNMMFKLATFSRLSHCSNTLLLPNQKRNSSIQNMYQFTLSNITNIFTPPTPCCLSGQVRPVFLQTCGEPAHFRPILDQARPGRLSIPLSVQVAGKSLM